MGNQAPGKTALVKMGETFIFLSPKEPVFIHILKKNYCMIYIERMILIWFAKAVWPGREMVTIDL